ncbi:flagellar hook assembly protein FlgD [Cognatishimia maritima]|uniref:Basal-body rod modification protein FlgD n=1 Tax=Cognatishimia maritima TaxID=870908 RepID=A0A1M5VTI3_9RHOB|nr:flagellar hook assembly protein FlgD [Cognatishimia maritima]SHH78508.1 flagellar basal-body rod modification protein FlgD [Cognatishimia maritima]
MALSPISSGAATGTSSTTSLSQLGEDYTRFLTLLTAQVQYQDPLQPMDATQFVSQLAQLSQVEQAVKTNSNLEGIGGQISSLLSASGADLLGKEVTVYSNQLTLTDGVVDSYYQVPEGTQSVTAEIRDPLTDTVVRTMTGLSTEHSALQKLEWDGLDDFGNPVLDGSYEVSITATDAEDAAVQSFVYRKAIVQEVLFTEGQNYFKLFGDETVPAEAILAAAT